MNKKGITPIIAMILLLMMTVASAAAAFYWLTKIQGQMMGGAEQYEEKSFERMASTISWIDANYNRTGGDIIVYIQNVGTTEIPVDAGTTDPTTSWILKDKNQDIICSTKLAGTGTAPNVDPICSSGCSGSLVPSQTGKLIINTNNTYCDISSETNGSLFYVSFYFSGKATASGTFEK